MSTVIVRTAGMYLVWAVPHFVIHVGMADRLSPALGIVLLILLGLAVLIPLALRVVTILPRRAPSLGP